MRTALLTSNLTGLSFVCHATTEHPDSHHGCPVWVDNRGRAYCEVDKPSEYYTVDERVDGNPRVVIGQRIADLRKAAGLTQAQLSKKSGVNVSNLCRIEAGKYSAGLDVLARIAEVLGSRLDLVTDTDQ